jgi:hypothetical protein
MPRFTDDQLSLARLRLVDALESAAVAFWTEEECHQVAFARAMESACEAVGFRIVPVTEPAAQIADAA